MADNINPKYFEKLAQIESSNNPNAKAKTSSAAGLYQFTKGTWNDLVKQLDLDYTEDDRFDPDKSRVIIEKFTEDNKKYLESRLGRSVNEGELYLAHFLGRNGAKNILEKLDQDTNLSVADTVSPNAIKANKSIFLNEDGTHKNIIDVYNWANKKMGVSNDKSSIDSRRIENSSLPPEQQQTLIKENETNGLSQDTIDQLDFSFQSNPFNSSNTTPSALANFTPNFAVENNFAYTKDIKAFKDGGTIQSDDLGTEINEFNVGGKHEDHPLGGIPLGTNEQGGLNLVEEGETKFNDYIFSDTLTISKEDLENSGMSEAYEGLTYAEVSKKIKKQIEDRSHDKIAKDTAEQQLNQLIYSNEKTRMKQDNSKKKKDKKLEGGGGIGVNGYLGMATTALNIGNDLFGNTGIDTSGASGKQEEVSVGGGALSGALSGASAGLATGNPILAGGMALAGGLGGLFGAKKKNEEIKEGNQNASLAYSGQFDNQFEDGGSPFGSIFGDNKIKGGLGKDWWQPVNNNMIATGQVKPSGLLDASLTRDLFDIQMPTLNSDYSGLNLGPLNLDKKPTGEGSVRNLELEKNRYRFLLDTGNEDTAKSSMFYDPKDWKTNSSNTTSTASTTSTTSTAPQPTNTFDVNSYQAQLKAFEDKLKETPTASQLGATDEETTSLLNKISSLNSGDSDSGDQSKLAEWGNKALRAAPTIGNLFQYLNAPEAEKESLNRLDNRYKPEYFDEASLVNQVKNSAAGTRRAIVGASGGSGSAARSNLLASQVNELRGIGEAMIKGESINRQENTKAQQFNSQIDQVNLSQDNNEKQINAQNRAAAASNKQMLLNSLLSDLGSMGKEGQLNDILKNTLGYSATGKAANRDNEKGGFLSNLYTKMNDPKRQEINKFLKDNYGY